MAVNRRIWFGLAALCAVPALLGGCGSSGGSSASSTDAGDARQAASGFVADTKTCPETTGSWTFRPTVVNLVNQAIVMRAGEYTCDDWSGVSTPGDAFNSVMLIPDQKARFTLEPRDNRNLNWTMEFSPRGGTDPFGTARISTTRSSGKLSVAGSKAVQVTKTEVCDVLQLAAVSRVDTPMSEWSRIPRSDALALVVSQGHFAVVSSCRLGKAGGTVL